jgi:hypothetical protein
MFVELGTVDTCHNACGFSAHVNPLVQPAILNCECQGNLADLHAIIPAERNGARQRIVLEVDRVVAAAGKISPPYRPPRKVL